MATGAPGTNGVWQYGEDDSEATFSALLNKAASTTDTQIGLDRGRLTNLEQAGRIVQVVQTVKNDAFSTTSLSYVDVTGVSRAITPRSSNNKILVTIAFLQSINTSNQTCQFQIMRNTTVIGNTSSGIMAAPYMANGMGGTWVTLNFLDTPSTTSSTTYKLQMRLSNTGTGYVGTYAASPSTFSLTTITLSEVVG